MALNWVPRPGHPLVWDADIDMRHKASIIGGIQRFEGRQAVEVETYTCFIDGKNIGQQTSAERAKEWCEQIAGSMIEQPLRIDGEMHLWMIVPQGPDRRAEGCIYGDPRFKDGRRITTENIVSIDWDADGDLITTSDRSYFRLCRQERTAELITLGYKAPKPDGKA